jgi:hypothetical protein
MPTGRIRTAHLSGSSVSIKRTRIHYARAFVPIHFSCKCGKILDIRPLYESYICPNNYYRFRSWEGQ